MADIELVIKISEEKYNEYKRIGDSRDVLFEAIRNGTPQPKSEVLDKIRAEISEVYNDRPYDYNHSQRTELFCKVMKIIDKYKAESEDKE